ncbi:DUF262 domain-containing protein [Oceanospirillum beijerinckii]|uniref:DUF262 domain-containing protein n=1 Tax=Oceanospirillum beijerinckii TaxID=64976 RepID=UPI0004205833|nr:DUF262 domain-containing protein [Oceanospirillum beijerinckii]
MAGEYEKAISIKDAVDAINHKDFLLPAIQRKFVWSSHQICVLFDSIMRGYPINSFMMWEVNDEKLKNDYRFYEFLTFYCQRFHEENPIVKTNASFKNFKAIIDGQQRLTSLYIGLCGSYAYKQPRKHWPSTKDDKILPPRKLYLDLKQPIDSESDESLMRYNFKFLTDSQYKKNTESEDGKYHWFCLHDILSFPQYGSSDDVLLDIVLPYLDKANLSGNAFARKTLLKLYDVVRSQRLIHYFNETSQEIDHVLDVFIRTNSGGTKLDFSDLLMSIAIAHWDGGFRKELDDLTRNIYQSAEMGFYMDRDWILKTCLVLTESDVRFKVQNFHSGQVEIIQSEWGGIKECIKQALLLIRRFGINPQSLTSKNAVIPICYYLYKKNVGNERLYKVINSLNKHSEERICISKWFYMVLLKGVFGGQADSTIKKMRDVINQNIESEFFPIEQVVEKFKGTNKDLRFDEDYLDSLLDIQHGEGRCRALLHLLFPEMNPTEVFHIDHLHPRSWFEPRKLKQYPFLADDSDKQAFYQNSHHWNSIANLHLLNDSQNISKSDRPLEEWLSRDDVYLGKDNLLIRDISLSFEDFPEFYKKRRDALRLRLRQRVFMTSPIPVEPSADDSDDEVVELEG